MIGSKSSRARHLHDDSLYECYVAEQTGDAIDPRAAEHLADCADCHARYADLAAFMVSLRNEADAEIDAVYSTDALQAQQTQIARRLEHLGHAARVISFPHHSAQGAVGGHGSRITPRWVAAAAAAGLFVGVGVGSVMQSVPFSHIARGARAPITAPAPAAPQAAVPEVVPVSAPESTPASTVDSDDSDKFLDEIEYALQRPRTNELLALDELTPHVRDISLISRVQ